MRSAARARVSSAVIVSDFVYIASSGVSMKPFAIGMTIVVWHGQADGYVIWILHSAKKVDGVILGGYVLVATYFEHVLSGNQR